MTSPVEVRRGDRPVTVRTYVVGLVVSLLGFLATGAIAFHFYEAERSSRRSDVCAAIAHQTFASTAELHAYEVQLACPVGGTVPVGTTGRPINLPPPMAAAHSPAPTVTVRSTTTDMRPAVVVTRTAQVRVTATRVVVRVSRPPAVRVTVTATKTCLPAGLLC